MNSEQFDLVTIGDITSDAFIRLREAQVHCQINQENCTITMRFGDKIPYESVTVVPAVGNAPNAAVAAARLGLRTALVSNLGDDANGAADLASLTKDQVSTGWVTEHPGRLTNYHYVLWYQDDRTILIKHEEYDYKLPTDFVQGKAPAWIYLSSLGEHSLPFHHSIAEYLKAHPEIKLAFQPGTFQITFGKEALAEIYARTEIFFSNVEETERILQMGTNGSANETNKIDHIKKLLAGIKQLGPKMVVLTDGPNGAYASADGQTWFMPPYPDPRSPLERTGAGDAFSSTVTCALTLGKTLPEALAWGPINSMAVVQKIGAQAGLLTRAELEKYLQEAPSDYQPRPL